MGALAGHAAREKEEKEDLTTLDLVNLDSTTSGGANGTKNLSLTTTNNKSSVAEDRLFNVYSSYVLGSYGGEGGVRVEEGTKEIYFDSDYTPVKVCFSTREVI